MPLLQVLIIEVILLWEGNPFPDGRGRDASPTGADN